MIKMQTKLPTSEKSRKEEPRSISFFSILVYFLRKRL